MRIEVIFDSTKFVARPFTRRIGRVRIFSFWWFSVWYYGKEEEINERRR